MGMDIGEASGEVYCEGKRGRFFEKKLRKKLLTVAGAG